MSALALALLVGFFPGERPDLYVRDQILPEDCGPTICNISPAIDRTLAVADLVPTPVGMRPQGSKIHLPCGEFQISKPIDVHREHTITGCGGAGWGAPTLLRSMTSTHAIVIRTSGAWAILQDFGIRTDLPSETSDRHGIKAEGRAFIDRVYIRGFVHGYHAVGWAVGNHTNINGGALTGLRIEGTEHAGIYIDGPDSNAILFQAIDIGSACQKASKWVALGPCAGIFESSFLGNTFVATQVAGTKEGTAPMPGYNFDSNGNQRSTCVGCYSEIDNAPGIMSVNTDILGGIGQWTGPGLRLEGVRASSLRVWGVSSPAGTPELLLGAAGGLPGTVLMATPPQIANPLVPPNATLRLRLGTATGKRGWYWDMAGLGIGVSQRVLAEPGKYGVTSIKTSTAVNP